MNAMAEKLKDAGVDTVGARFTAACVDAIRKHPDSAVDAWRAVGSLFGYEFVRGLMNDIHKSSSPAKDPQQVAATQYRQTVDSLNRATDRQIAAPYKPRVIPPEQLEKQRELRQVIRSKYKNSGGIPWSDVGIHEGQALVRDGAEAAALNAAIPIGVPNDGKTYGDVLGVQRVDEIIKSMRK